MDPQNRVPQEKTAMHSLVVLAHPEPRSFNGRLARAARETLEAGGYTTRLLDLYGEGFDPREAPEHYPARRDPGRFSAMSAQRRAAETGRLPPDVARAIGWLEQSDLVVFQCPLWWFSLPAMLKGWLDRVFAYGAVYDSRMRYDRGRFRGRRALVSITTGGPAASHGPDGRQGDLDLLLWPLHFSLHYVGFSVLPPWRSFAVEGGRFGADPEAHRRHLAACEAGLRRHLAGLDALQPLPFNGWDDWDAEGRLKSGAPSHGPFMRHLPETAASG
ncbi:NAD(P)H dehydrogenase (quinone) [Tistlia consotensis]|uniref:NAD(P)H dehydrogenase (Quinone) n=1 Tax=Tistlia consotensis USBA 355 TaxID=560819 RepID=A0A1Y6CT07_9PROT|nr:NAD(P)H-dependent oxidoreductase [Tistlia consotensis]SMF71799.1 NAD(P)H dehydrogenase (quinone) [Tistlia consotensis USBA 355]SNS06238.1 NAD(P)H dehydrogenase (quinone) [Tistlia consotensis]